VFSKDYLGSSDKAGAIAYVLVINRIKNL